MITVQHNPALFKEGDKVTVSVKYPVGHYRVPMYLRGKTVSIVSNLGRHINPEEEAFGRNAGNELWYYMVEIPQQELWPDYHGQESDQLQIEVFENWLEPINI
jgi:hypothetical protein